MANDNNVTVVGNLTRDPELRYTTSGTAVADIGIAVNQRKKVGDDWEDDPSFFNVTAWKELAEHAEQSLVKGCRVIVTGRLDQQTWETDEGDKRSAVKIIADDIAPSLRWATAEVTRIKKESVGGERPPIADEEPF